MRNLSEVMNLAAPTDTQVGRAKTAPEFKGQDNCAELAPIAEYIGVQLYTRIANIEVHLPIEERDGPGQANALTVQQQLDVGRYGLIADSVGKSNHSGALDRVICPEPIATILSDNPLKR